MKFVGRMFEAENAIKTNSYKKEKEAISNICSMIKLNFAAIKFSFVNLFSEFMLNCTKID